MKNQDLINKTIPLINSQNRALTKEQKAFNEKVTKIEQLKKRNAEHKILLEGVSETCLREIAPLEAKLREQRYQSLNILEKQLKKSSRIFNKNYKDSIRELITCGAISLLHEFGDPRGQAFLERHIENDSINDLEQDLQGFFSRFDGWNADEGKPFSTKIDEERKKRPSKKREKHLKDIKAETKGLYRKLAMEYHPDKELDENQKTLKSEAFQKINDAYRTENFYELIKIDTSLSEDSFSSDKKIKMYNAELNSTIRSLNADFKVLKEESSLSIFHQLFYSKSESVRKKKITDRVNELMEEIEDENSLQKKISNADDLKRLIDDDEFDEDEGMDEFFDFMENVIMHEDNQIKQGRQKHQKKR